MDEMRALHTAMWTDGTGTEETTTALRDDTCNAGRCCCSERTSRRGSDRCCGSAVGPMLLVGCLVGEVTCTSETCVHDALLRLLGSGG